MDEHMSAEKHDEKNHRKLLQNTWKVWLKINLYKFATVPQNFSSSPIRQRKTVLKYEFRTKQFGLVKS